MLLTKSIKSTHVSRVTALPLVRMKSHHRPRSSLLNSGGEDDEAASGRVEARAEGVDSRAGGRKACQYVIAASVALLTRLIKGSK